MFSLCLADVYKVRALYNAGAPIPSYLHPDKKLTSTPYDFHEYISYLNIFIFAPRFRNHDKIVKNTAIPWQNAKAIFFKNIKYTLLLFVYSGQWAQSYGR